MSFFRHFLQGWLLILRFPLYTLAKWALNLIFAWILVAPLSKAFESLFSHRAAAEHHANQWSLGGISEFFDFFQEQLPGQPQNWMLLVGAYAAINILLSAGILNGFANHCRSLPAEFWSGVRSHFLPLALLPVGFLFAGYFAHMGWARLEGLALTPTSPLWMDWVLAGLGVWCLWFAWLVYDYSRMILCAGKDASQRHPGILHALLDPIVAVGRGILLVLTRPAAWLISLVFIGIQGIWIYGLYAGWFTTTGKAALWLGQLVILGRMATTLALWGSEMSLWVSLAAATNSEHAPTSVGIEEVYPAPVVTGTPVETTSEKPEIQYSNPEEADADDIYRRAGSTPSES